MRWGCKDVISFRSGSTNPPFSGQFIGTNQSKWANRKLLPEYEAMTATGAFTGGTDSKIALSEERDAR